MRRSGLINAIVFCFVLAFLTVPPLPAQTTGNNDGRTTTKKSDRSSTTSLSWKNGDGSTSIKDPTTNKDRTSSRTTTTTNYGENGRETGSIEETTFKDEDGHEVTREEDKDGRPATAKESNPVNRNFENATSHVLEPIPMSFVDKSQLTGEVASSERDDSIADGSLTGIVIRASEKKNAERLSSIDQPVERIGRPPLISPERFQIVFSPGFFYPGQSHSANANQMQQTNSVQTSRDHHRSNQSAPTRAQCKRKR